MTINLRRLLDLVSSNPAWVSGTLPATELVIRFGPASPNDEELARLVRSTEEFDTVAGGRVSFLKNEDDLVVGIRVTCPNEL
jgi:hypothetical protein